LEWRGVWEGVVALGEV
jgi:hypothetical protein